MFAFSNFEAQTWGQTSRKALNLFYTLYKECLKQYCAYGFWKNSNGLVSLLQFLHTLVIRHRKNHEVVSGLWKKITWTDRQRRSKTPRWLYSCNSNNYGRFVKELVVKNMFHVAVLECYIYVTTAGPSPDCENWTCFASQWFFIVRSILGWPRKCYWIHTSTHKTNKASQSLDLSDSQAGWYVLFILRPT